MNAYYNNACIVSAKGMVYGSFSIQDSLFSEFGIEAYSNGLDLEGMYVIPGFVDTHIHGFGSYDLSRPDCDYCAADRALARRGTTSYFATVSAPKQKGCLEQLVKNRVAAPGCKGFHLEGPFINPKRKGGFADDNILPFSQHHAEALFEGFEGSLRVMTAAPECVDIQKLGQLAQKYHVVLSAGHTQASYETAKMAFQQAFSLTTHTFNAMPQLHHRIPGILDAALLEHDIYSEVIGDLRHVSLQCLMILLRAKGTDRLLAITDSVPLLQPGLTVKNKLVYYGDTIYGSQSSMYDVFVNLVQKAGLSLPQAVRLTSYNASALYGLCSGELAEGKQADFLVLDRRLKIDSVFRAGKRLDLD